MAEKTLAEVWGSNATQTATTIALDKGDLGLTAAVCTADQVLAAMAIKAKPIMTPALFETEPQQKVYLSDGFNSFTVKGNDQFIVRQIVINLAEPDGGASLNPNIY